LNCFYYKQLIAQSLPDVCRQACLFPAQKKIFLEKIPPAPLQISGEAIRQKGLPFSAQKNRAFPTA